MFEVNNDLSIHITRGDIALLTLTADSGNGACVFAEGDIVRFKVYEKKGCDCVVLMKDITVEETTETVNILLTGDDTRIGELIHKPKDYWYEVELNPDTNPQTIIGYDDDGAKVFRLYPEGKEIEDITEEDMPFVDSELSSTSKNPVENRVITAEIEALKQNGGGIPKIELAKGETMNIFDLPQWSIATGKFKCYNQTIDLNGALVTHDNTNCAINNGTIVRIIQGDISEDSQGNITYDIMRDITYPLIHLHGEYIEHFGNWWELKTNTQDTLVDAINEVNDKVDNEPEYELITRMSFDELDIVNSNIPDGKSTAWREKTVNFNKAYKAVFFMVYCDVQSIDKASKRDSIHIFHGDKGGACTFEISGIMANSETRFTRAKVERKNGLWWLEYLVPTKNRYSMAELRTTQSAFGFAAERIDAEEGIVDETHLSKTENITSWTIQMTMPSDGTVQRNPIGSFAIFGIPAN